MDDAAASTAAERTKAASSGTALPGGAFPINNVADLKNAIQAYGRAKNPAVAKAHIIKRAKALKAMFLLPKGWASDAAMNMHYCPDPLCERAFLDVALLHEHAEAVHSFGDIRQILSQAVQEKFGRKNDPQATPPKGGVWTCVVDLADDWVVFSASGDQREYLLKATYTMDADDVVKFAAPQEVVRRTVYDVVKKAASTPASTPTGAQNTTTAGH